MRFKAKLMSDQLALFHAVISPISKLQDTHRGTILYLDEEYVRVSCKTSESSGITCFAELSPKDLFVDHRIESANDNVIVCQVDLVSFRLALQSVVQGGGNSFYHHKDGRANSTNNPTNSTINNQSVLQSLVSGQQVVILKLAKRNNMPCLCLEGKHISDNDVDIHQAIPVRIMRRQEMQNHLPPHINHPQVQLELPMDRPIRPVIDKLKAMGQFVFVEGNMKGDLTIRMDHDGASLACFYNHLVPRWPDDDDDVDENVNNNYNNKNVATGPNVNASCKVKVDVQKLSACLQWQQFQSHLPMTSCLLCMVYNEMLVLHVVLYPEKVGFFTYYLPVQFLLEEDMA